jgi:hypothetical protein
VPVLVVVVALWELWETRLRVFQGAAGAVFGVRSSGSFHSESTGVADGGLRRVRCAGTLSMVVS